MSACILTSTERIFNAALIFFVFQTQKSNNIYISVQELDHLLPLSYFDNFLYFKKLNQSWLKAASHYHICWVIEKRSFTHKCLLGVISGNACTVKKYTDLVKRYILEKLMVELKLNMYVYCSILSYDVSKFVCFIPQ